MGWAVTRYRDADAASVQYLGDSFVAGGSEGLEGLEEEQMSAPPYAPPLLSRGLVTDTACNQLNLIDGLTVSSGRNPDLRRREAGWQGGSMMW